MKHDKLRIGVWWYMYTESFVMLSFTCTICFACYVSLWLKIISVVLKKTNQKGVECIDFVSWLDVLSLQNQPAKSLHRYLCHFYVLLWNTLFKTWFKKFIFNLRRMLWVKNYPHLWLLPHNLSSLWGNTMKFCDFVNEGLVPVLIKIGVSGWINIRVKKTKLYKTLSTLWVCAHPYSHCRTLARHTSWVLRHPCFAKEWNLSLACRGCGGTHALQRSEICPLHAIYHGCEGTHAFWRAGIESFPCVPVLSAVISLWSFAGTAPCSCFFGGSGFDGNSKSSAVCN